MAWIQSPDSKGWIDTDQAVPEQSLINWFEQMFIYQCWLDSMNIRVLDTPMFEYDVKFLIDNKKKLSNRIQLLMNVAPLQKMAPFVSKTITKEEKKKALMWALRNMYFRACPFDYSIQEKWDIAVAYSTHSNPEETRL